MKPETNENENDVLPSGDGLLPQSREYQSHILGRLEALREQGRNAIVELDCGLGKRFLMWKLLGANSRTLLLLDSSSSLADTEQYMKTFGGVKRNFDVISGRTPSWLRLEILKGTGHVLAMPGTLENTLRKDPSLHHGFEVIIVNEVDKIAKRTSHGRTLTVPWNRLLPRFSEKFVIGMSGTLRDPQVVFDEEQAKIRSELDTIKEAIPNSELISMEDYFDTDVDAYISPTYVSIVEVNSENVKRIADDLSGRLKELVKQMLSELDDSQKEQIRQQGVKFEQIIHSMPIREDLTSRYMGMALLRKYLYSMPPEKFTVHARRAQPDFGFLPSPSDNANVTAELAMSANKTVVLCSYVSTVRVLEEMLTKKGILTFTMTGTTPMNQRGQLITDFRNCDEQATMLLSPVGERDLDIPEAGLLVVYDLVNSIKTVYQKIKRTRGGEVILLCYAETSETRKTKRVLDELLRRYPWSTVRS